MRGREDSFSSCNQKADCLRSHPSSMLLPTDRRLSCHSGLAVTLSTTEKLKTRLSLWHAVQKKTGVLLTYKDSF